MNKTVEIHAEELWDKYSQYVDDDLDSLQNFAGQSVVKRSDFIAAIIEAATQVKESLPTPDSSTGEPKKYYERSWEEIQMYDRLFKAITDTGVAPLQSEMDDIIRIVHEDFPKSKTDSSTGMRWVIEKRIKELNIADSKFCEDRWNMDLPNIQRALAREESNKVTFARQELESLLSTPKEGEGWIRVEDSTPIAYKTGDFDGMKSDLVLIKYENGEFGVAVMYEGYMDGNHFKEWYDNRDFDIPAPIYWKTIN